MYDNNYEAHKKTGDIPTAVQKKREKLRTGTQQKFPGVEDSVPTKKQKNAVPEKKKKSRQTHAKKSNNKKKGSTVGKARTTVIAVVKIRLSLGRRLVTFCQCVAQPY